MADARERRQLLVVTRLGLRFGDRELETIETFARRLAVLQRLSATFVASSSVCGGWIIETDEAWFDELTERVADGHIPHPPGGKTVVSRRGTEWEAEDLAALGVDERRLLTVRLDSDDVYHHPALSRALSISSSLPDGVLIDFPHGYLASVDDAVVQRHSYAMQGPFFGITTTGADLSGIHGEHMAAGVGRQVRVIAQPAWTQTVHGDNIVTGLEVGSPIAHLRKLRRAWKRRAPTRRWTELPRYSRVALRVTSSKQEQLLVGLRPKGTR